jgi:hypothetical protein
MEKKLQFVTLKQGYKLKEMGFDWECDHSYIEAGIVKTGSRTNSDYSDRINRCTAPTVALALKWFRDVKGFMCCVSYGDNCNEEVMYYACIYHPDFLSQEYDTYEAAESALLDELLKLES